MQNNNSLGIAGVVNKIAEDFLKGYYTASMYELRKIAKQKKFTDEEKKHLERVFMLPNDGAIEVYFNDNDEMIILTRTPVEQEKHNAHISRISYLIKNGYSNIDTTNEYLDVIKRYLKKENVEITNIIEKGSIALITINNENFNLISDNNKNNQQLSENQELLFAEDKITTSKQIQESFDEGNYTLTIKTIKQLQERNNFTEWEIKDLTKVYKLSNKAAVEIYFDDNKLVYEERTAKEQEFYEIQIERLKSLMYGEVDKLSILAHYYDMAIRFLKSNEIEIKSIEQIGVFHEIKVKPIIKPVEDDFEIAKKRQQEKEEKEKLERIEQEKKQREQRQTVVKTEVARQRLNIRERIESLNIDTSSLTELPTKPVESKTEENNNQLKEENVKNSEKTTETHSVDYNTSHENVKQDKAPSVETKAESKGTMQTTMQPENAVDMPTDIFENENQNIKDKEQVIETKEQNIEAQNQHSEIENQQIEVENKNIENDSQNIYNEEKLNSENFDNSDDVLESESVDNKEDNDDEDGEYKSDGDDFLNELDYINLEEQLSDDLVNSDDELEDEDEGNIEEETKSKYPKIDLTDKEQFSKAKTDIFWELQFLRFKTNFNINTLLNLSSLKYYNIVSPVYTLFKGAASGLSDASTILNPSSNDFYTYTQLNRLNLISFNKNSDNEAAKKIVSAFLGPTMNYSKTESFNETIEDFLMQPKLMYELKNGSTTLEIAIKEELKDPINNELKNCEEMFLNRNPVDVLKILKEFEEADSE